MHGLKDFIRNYRVCNMHVERLLALFKKSVVEATPDVTKFACNGYLSQQMHDHIAAGGCDPRHNERRDELLAKGVPLQRGQAQKRQKKIDTNHKSNVCFLIRHTGVLRCPFFKERPSSAVALLRNLGSWTRTPAGFGQRWKHARRMLLLSSVVRRKMNATAATSGIGCGVSLADNNQ